MKYRPLGRSGIQASVVGLGTFAIGGWFWGGTDEKRSVEAIHASIDAGINLIDTAPIYGYGLAEEVLGKAMKGRRDKVVLATKGGLRWDLKKGVFFTHADEKAPSGTPSKYEVYRCLDPESLREELERSLKRLCTDYIDLYQTHWQDETTPIADTMAMLLKLKDQGKIRAIGVSNITMAQLEAYGAIASIQEKFSLIDRHIEEQGILDYCVAKGISVLSYFTMEQGLLTGTMSPDREFPEGDTRRGNPKFSPENRRLANAMLEELKPFAENYGVGIGQLVIALTAAQRGITHVLVGARDAKQALENAVGGTIQLSLEDVKTMTDTVNKARGKLAV